MYLRLFSEFTVAGGGDVGSGPGGVGTPVGTTGSVTAVESVAGAVSVVGIDSVDAVVSVIAVASVGVVGSIDAVVSIVSVGTGGMIGGGIVFARHLSKSFLKLFLCLANTIVDIINEKTAIIKNVTTLLFKTVAERHNIIL